MWLSFIYPLLSWTLWPQSLYRLGGWWSHLNQWSATLASPWWLSHHSKSVWIIAHCEALQFAVLPNEFLDIRVCISCLLFSTLFLTGSRNSLLVEHRTRDRMVASSKPGRSGGRIFFSRVHFVCWLLFGVRSTLVLPQWHIQDPGHSAKSASDRLHLNTRMTLTQQSQSGLTMPLSRHSVRTYPETSSHATYQGTRGHSRLRSLYHCGLILA